MISFANRQVYPMVNWFRRPLLCVSTDGLKLMRRVVKDEDVHWLCKR